MKNNRDERRGLSRRGFLKAGGAVLAAGALGARGARGEDAAEQPVARISRHRRLGRTEFKVSDISLGCAPISDPNLIRYAHDHGVNYFDTAETYGDGASERAIGEAMPHLEREKIFVTTKLLARPDDTEENLRDRFASCLERLQTDRADALYIHDVQQLDLVDHAAFHAAAASLKADGRLKHLGISSHGPRGAGASMADVLVKATEDGRFDLMLFTCNFLNSEEADRVLAACAERDIGTTAMKTVPGYLNVEPWDDANPHQPYLDYIERVGQQGVSRPEAIERIKMWIAQQQGMSAQMKPFVEKHGVDSQERLRESSIQWVLGQPRMHTVCVSMADFDSMERLLGLSGTELGLGGSRFLEDFRYAVGGRYCRHSCSDCLSACPQDVPVSTIMRYSYYFAMQGREKYAMGKYARLGDHNVTRCMGCDAPCTAACPHGVAVPANLLQADALLRLA